VHPNEHLLIVGASARAAAFSALRAGLRPWCVDLFADADLRAVCPAHPLAGRYPHGFVEWFDRAPGPWMYTGGLENHPALVRRLARLRPLWGNDEPVLRWARDPFFVADLLRRTALPVLDVLRAGESPPSGRWLVKPRRGAGGQGIRFHGGHETIASRSYVQRYVEGEPRAAVYVADGRRTRLLGVSRQLVGEEWLHASAFHYCGSIGPVSVTAEQARSLERLGEVVASGCGLRGLFGIDGIWHKGGFWPVEVNPRYTASVEMLERATGLVALDWHRRAFVSDDAFPTTAATAGAIEGKAVLFARRDLIFPAHIATEGFADLPDPGQMIEAGRPVLTFFARASTVSDCQAALRRIAVDIDGALYGGSS
jgi:uncharacterized protein